MRQLRDIETADLDMATSGGRPPRRETRAPLLFGATRAAIGSVTCFSGQLPAGAPAAERAAHDATEARHRHYLSAAMGIVSSRIASLYPDQPENWADAGLWAVVARMLPRTFYRAWPVERVDVAQRAPAHEIPARLLGALAPWADPRSAERPFAVYLDEIAAEARWALRRSGGPVRLYALAMTHQPVRGGDGWRLASQAQFFSVAISDRQASLLEGTGSAAMLNLSLPAASALVTLDGVALIDPENAEARAAWDRVVRESDRDELDQAPSYCGLPVAL